MDDFPLPEFHGGQRLALKRRLTGGRVIGMEVDLSYGPLHRREVRYQVEWPDLPGFVMWWPQECLTTEDEMVNGTIGEIRTVNGSVRRTMSYARYIGQVVVTVYASKVDDDDPAEFRVDISNQEKRLTEPPWLNQAQFDAVMELMTYAVADSTAAWT